MSETQEPRGLRAVPPTIVIAFGAWLALYCVRIVFTFAAKDPWSSIRLNLISDGLSFAETILLLVGAFEMARRSTGVVARGMSIVAYAFIAVLVFDVGFGLVQNMIARAWEHEWLFKVSDYGYYLVWLPIPIGLAIANWRDNRALAIVIVVAYTVSWPPPFATKALLGWIPEGKGGYTIHIALNTARVVSMLLGFIAVARGQASPERTVAGDGLRLAARALWLRVMAAVGLVLLTLLAIAGGGGATTFATLKLAMIGAALINLIAFTQFGLGVVRVGRAALPDLGRWPLVIGGATSLWAAGVTLTQGGYLYKMLYGDSGSFDRDITTQFAQALTIALPIVVIVGVALLAVAIGGFAARVGNEELRTDAQAKGAGFVALSLVSLAIQAWMIPKAMAGGSLGSFAGLSLLAAGAGLWGTGMMARLCQHAAYELDQEPGLPKASIVSDGT